MMIMLNQAVVHLLVVLSIFGGITGKKYRFHLPWACAALYETGHLIGACSIFDSNKVLVSVDNFRRKAPGSNPPKTFYHKVVDGSVYVHVGSNYMNVDIVNPKPKYAQKRKASKLSVVFKNSESNGENRKAVFEFRDNPNRISPDDGAEYDVFGLAFNVGILALHEPFTWNPYVQPMLIRTFLKYSTERFSKSLRRVKIQTDACVTYSWSHNRIRYHEVMYIDDDSCLELFCKWKLSTCLEFPAKHNLLKCFKSTKYSDVCPSARGAALYCPEFDKSVFGILTTAPSCGLWNMPGVYTTLPKVIEFVEQAYNVSFPDYEKREKYDLYSLQQRNDDYDGIP